MSIRTIDISHWEGDYAHSNPPSWAGAIVDGVEIGITKVSEKMRVDSMFEFNWWMMERYGLSRMGYHFWSPTDGALEGKNFSTALLGQEIALPDACPAILDFEPSLSVYPTRIVGVDTKVKAFLDVVEALTGQKPIIYTGVPYWNRHFPTAPAWLPNYKLWLAAYPTKISATKNQWDMSAYSYQTPVLPKGWTRSQLKMWQFSDRGLISGFSGFVDLDYYYPDI